MFHWPAPYFAVEAVQQLGPSVAGFHLATGGQQWYIVGCYLAPGNTLTIESVVAALKERPRGAELLVTGDFNINLVKPEGDLRGEDITAAMATEGLEDMSAHFLLVRRLWWGYGWLWSMIREGREVRSRTDYILGTDCRLFGNFSVRDPRHNSDHYMVLVFLHRASLREHSRYLVGRKRPLLCPPTKPTREYRMFAALWRAAGSAEERMDVGNNVETCQRESLRMPGYRERASFNLEFGPRHKGKPDEGQETAGTGGGRGGGGTVRFGPPSAPGSLAPDQGVVQGCGRPCSAVSCPSSGLPLWRGPTSRLKLALSQYPGMRRLSR